MVSISRKLSLIVKRDDIELQKTLSKIGYFIDTKEKTKEIFGKTTEKAIRRFQSENGLQITGIDDDKTADKIMKIIQENRPQGRKKLARS